ncbi:MAG: transposase [Bacteroides cellulosilyticus]
MRKALWQLSQAPNRRIIVQVLKQINEKAREAVEEVTLDLSDSMRRIVTIAFPKAKRVIRSFSYTETRL